MLVTASVPAPVTKLIMLMRFAALEAFEQIHHNLDYRRRTGKISDSI
jgi:hypothetical protein